MLKYKEAIIFIVFTIVALVVGVINIQPLIVQTMDIENKIKTQSQQVVDLQRQLDSLKQKAMEKLDLSAQTKKIYQPETQGLDAESSFTVVFDDIIDMAKYNGLKIYSILYTYNPADDEFVKGAADRYNVCVLSTQIISDYADLESFLKELLKYPYLINIDKFEITPYPKNKRILVTNLQIKLYTSK